MIPYEALRKCIEENKHSKPFSSIKGIYVFIDRRSKTPYIGSAYGAYGLSQGWNCYLDTNTGANQGLIGLYAEKGESYFMDNLLFNVLEVFGKDVEDFKILEKEAHWKRILFHK